MKASLFLLQKIQSDGGVGQSVSMASTERVTGVVCDRCTLVLCRVEH